MTDTVDTGELRRLAGEATPGPWLLGRDEEGGTHFIAQHGFGGGGPNYYADAHYPTDEADGRLVCAAVNALPSLLDEIDALRGVAEAARAHGATWSGRGHTGTHADLRAALDRLDSLGGPRDDE